MLFAQEYSNTSYTTKNGLPHNLVYDVIKDRKGFIWVITRNGTARFDGEKFTNFSIEDGLPTNELLGVKVDFANRVWFSGLNGEICFYKDGKFTNFANAL